MRNLDPRIGNGHRYRFTGNFTKKRKTTFFNRIYDVSYYYAGNGIINYTYSVRMELRPERIEALAYILGVMGLSGIMNWILGNDYEIRPGNETPSGFLDWIYSLEADWGAIEELTPSFELHIPDFNVPTLPQLGTERPTAWENITGSLRGIWMMIRYLFD